jgi:hypothetical protein
VPAAVRRAPARRRRDRRPRRAPQARRVGRIEQLGLAVARACCERVLHQIGLVEVAGTGPSHSKRFWREHCAARGLPPERRRHAAAGAVQGRERVVLRGQRGPSEHFASERPTTPPCRGFHRVATAAGYRDNGEPGELARHHPGYCGAFVLDPTATRRDGQPQPLGHVEVDVEAVAVADRPLPGLDSVAEQLDEVTGVDRQRRPPAPRCAAAASPTRCAGRCPAGRGSGSTRDRGR